MDKIKCRVFIATSLDGFIARENGDIDWLEKVKSISQEDYGYSDFINDIDGIVMGRNTFEKVIGFNKWPYQCPVVVMSKTLSAENIPENLKSSVQIMSGAPAEIFKILLTKGWKRAYIDGGRLIQSFLSENLISDMIITKLPILLGKGRPLFRGIKNDLLLDHISTKSYPCGFVQSHYRVR